ncbi:hypothetical protein JCGZ_20904 [Jatropha curcas]|uniref:Uncharacterized protein n=1 Tax=Jatropha curcas TaxID=180498 RepID=A0A067LI37_JATCU|nr:hypothetical protein JCGZ_20904 [Jatropha curcas]
MEQLKLSDRMEELLMFTLQSHINQTLEVDLPLSKDFCSNLLRDEPNDSVSLPASSNTSSFGGVPQYPLFKRLALALCQSIISGSFCKTYNKIGFFEEDICPKQKEEQWNKLIIEKGFELMNVLKVAFYELHVQEPFFSQIKNGLKTVEGRCAGGKYSRMFDDMHHFWRCWKQRVLQKSFLVLKLLKKELSYDGVQSLLGLAHTAGTVPDALPPARSTLLSSFTLPYRPNARLLHAMNFF